MATGVGRVRPARRVAWLLPPVVAFVVCRALGLLAVVIEVRRAGSTGRVGALSSVGTGSAGSTGLAAVLRALALAEDGGWYARIAAHGYPRSLILESSGRAAHSALAFFPAYPAVVGAVERVLGVGFTAPALVLSLLAGAGAAAGVAALARSWAPPGTAALAGVLWAVQPASPVTGLAYTESLFTAELVGVLLALAHRRYGWLMLALVAAALTRGTMPPLILVVAVHLLRRLWERRRAGGASRPAGAGGLGAPAAALGVAVLSAPLWPAAVAFRTHRLTAYFLVQAGWNGPLTLFRPWWWATRKMLTAAPGQDVVPKIALLAVLLAVVLAVAALWSPMPIEQRVLAPAFLLYLLAVVPPSSSYPRFLLPVVTLPIAAAGLLEGRPAILRRLVVALCLIGQAGWLACYVLGFRHFTP